LGIDGEDLDVRLSRPRQNKVPMLLTGREELNRWARMAFLIIYPLWTLYKIIHHYSIWLHSSTPADRANHAFRAAAWAIAGVAILISLPRLFKKRTTGKIN
jgi:hypothetical protein